MFRGGFFVLLIHSLQLMGNNGGNATGVVVVIRESLVVMLFSSLGLSPTFFHKLLKQPNVVFEAVVLGDERTQEVELVGITGEGILGFLQLRLELSDRGRWNGGCGWFGGGLGWHDEGGESMGVWGKVGRLEGCIRGDRPLWRNSKNTDWHHIAESVVNLVHRATQ